MRGRTPTRRWHITTQRQMRLYVEHNQDLLDASAHNHSPFYFHISYTISQT